MVATKKQELEALAKIQKIVEGLGEDSYLAASFKGCFEDAKENIENDFGLSYFDRYETEAEKNRTLTLEVDELNKACELANSRYHNASQKATEANNSYQLLLASYDEATKKIERIKDSCNTIEEIIKRIEAYSMEDADKMARFSDDTDSEEFTEAVRNYKKNRGLINSLKSLVSNISNF